MPSTYTQKLVIKLLHINIHQISLKKFAWCFILRFFCKLLSGVVPFDVVMLVMERLDEYADIVVSAKVMLEFLFRLCLQFLADGIELFLSVCPFSKEVIDSVETASEGEEALVFEVRGGFWLGFHWLQMEF